jgi:hypothetical protein
MGTQAVQAGKPVRSGKKAQEWRRDTDFHPAGREEAVQEAEASVGSTFAHPGATTLKRNLHRFQHRRK